MKIYLCRHGETVLNKKKKWQGQIDSPLTEKGIKQAERTAAYLHKKAVDAIFVSPLGRAKATASFLTIRIPTLHCIEANCLKEINCGEAEGLTFNETRKKYPRLIGRINLRDLDSSFPGGESYNDVTKRLRPFVKMLKRNYPKKVIAIVAHGGVNRMLIGILRSLPNKELVEISTPNDAIYEIVLTKDASNIFNIKNGERKKGVILRSVS